MLAQNAAGSLVGFVHDIADLVVDLAGHFLAVAAALAQITAQEGLVLVGAVHHGAQTVREAVARYHGPGRLGGALQIVGSAGGNIVQNQLLGHTAAQQADDVFLHSALGDIAGVLIRQIHGIAAGLPAGNNADLMHRIVRGAEIARDGVAALVIGREALFLFGDHMALFLGACHHFDAGFLDLLAGDGFFAHTGGQQRSLVDKVFQISACKTGGGLGNGAQIHIRAQGLVAGVYLQNFFAALHIGQAHIDLAVKAARAQKCLIQNVGAVGGRHDDHAFVGIKAVHFHQQLVQGLLAFVMAAAKAGTALAAHSIDLVDKDNAGHALFGFFKQVAHAACAHAYIHFHKVRAGNGIERHTGLACTGTGQQGFTGARRAHQQNAVGNACAQAVELAGIAQKLHHFFQLGLFFISACHIGKGGLALALLLVFHLGAAHIHHTAATGAAAIHGEEHKAHAAQNDHIHHDLHPGDAGAHGLHIVHHGGIGVGLIVGIDILAHIIQEIIDVRQFVFYHIAAAVGLQHLFAAAQAQKACGFGIRKAGNGFVQGLAFLGQLHLAFFQAQFDGAVVEIQVKSSDLLVFKIADYLRVAHAVGFAGKA